jgi:hypothetical protein
MQEKKNWKMIKKIYQIKKTKVQCRFLVDKLINNYNKINNKIKNVLKKINFLIIIMRNILLYLN